MDANHWKNVILNDAEAVGTKKDSFMPIINTLATVLERRDAAYDEFIASGGETCIEKRSDRGAVNMAINPRLRAWMDLNDQAISMWDKLGLTPSGLKKINDKMLTKTKKNSLADVLKELG